MLSKIHQLNKKRIYLTKFKYVQNIKNNSFFVERELKDVQENILALKEELRLFQNYPENILIGI